eukprot:10359213-Alexandrium_andersonii.AAC.1
MVRASAAGLLHASGQLSVSKLHHWAVCLSVPVHACVRTCVPDPVMQSVTVDVWLIPQFALE